MEHLPCSPPGPVAGINLALGLTIYGCKPLGLKTGFATRDLKSSFSHTAPPPQPVGRPCSAGRHARRRGLPEYQYFGIHRLA